VVEVLSDLFSLPDALQVISGSSNCAAPPSSGFCADSNIAGVNVWSDISNNQVRKFVNPEFSRPRS